MASGKTEHYQLNQWSLDDPVQMEEFNQDNRAVDAALHELKNSRVRLATGSYIGTGACGPEHPSTLTFDFTPKLILIMNNGGGGLFFFNCAGITSYFSPSNTSAHLEVVFTWGENSVSWYNRGNASVQKNDEGKVYHYLVIGD